ncbi:hypothetical protein [Nodularia sphaerocarpa]|uniref:hypothetical protein n=1 Tax=Nodularia sphaerocarpa TaxID=137816 RepID=UPI001EFB950C|nr:hypothetical protein [Nodularia sphaerocarpa]MDB9374643.1 hypothetical protein [Nodularia sphaerocarpa CS-585]MDB9380006.1 hypothetical protein [Nodularia sphaerocarpa CS-585A2]ULP74877.1 hypothetical protein BDGGKGIB_04548 [Nodularia sphaerocarpa UHCC 0038]
MLKLLYYLIIITLTISGTIFYNFQNSHQGLGGAIALPKVFWLGYALWFWYFLPLLIGIDSRISSKWRQLYWIAWWNMAIRAVVELGMMYFAHNWHPYYGIAHDLFSAVLILGLIFTATTQTNIEQAVSGNFRIMGVMFVIEAYFAYYMLNNVHSDTGAVYFVPGKPEYQGIMLITWLVILVLTVQQIILARKWLYLPPEIDNPPVASH